MSSVLLGYKHKSIEELRLEDYTIGRVAPYKKPGFADLSQIGAKMEELEHENNQLRNQIGTLTFDVSAKQAIIDNYNEHNVPPFVPLNMVEEEPIFDPAFAEQLISGKNDSRNSLWRKIKAVTESTTQHFLT